MAVRQNILVTCGDTNVKLWDLGNLSCLHTLVHSHEVKLVTIAEDIFIRGKHFPAVVISASKDGAVKIWDLTGNLLLNLNGHNKQVNCIDVCNGILVTGSNDKTIKVWDLSTGDLKHTLIGHKNAVNYLGIYLGAGLVWPNLPYDIIVSKTISVSRAELFTRMWDLSTGKCFHRYKLDLRR